MPNYGEPKYWDKRYKDQENTTFDWLEDYESLQPIICPLIKPESKILVLGCGNAEFSENLYDDGFKNIFNIDISCIVIQQMKKRNESRKEMKYEIMDVMDIKYPDNYFDMAVDKSTIDALLCGKKAFANVAKMTKEVQRVLKVGGMYMVISYGKPENRMSHFIRDHLDFEISQYTISPESEEIKNDKMHYIYMCKKLPDADEKSLKNFTKEYNTLLEDYEKEAKLQGSEKEDDDSMNEDDDDLNIEHDFGKDGLQKNLNQGTKGTKGTKGQDKILTGQEKEIGKEILKNQVELKEIDEEKELEKMYKKKDVDVD